MTITLLSKPSCVQCAATERKLDAEKLTYSKEDIYEESNLAIVASLGYKAAPVVLVRDADGSIIDHWAGFNPAKISELASAAEAA